MSQSHIRIRGARTHNLKNVNLDIPRDKFVVIGQFITIPRNITVDRFTVQND